jgi:hypothetical protein
MAIAGSCLSTMEKPRFCITTSPESATLLYTQNTGKEHTGRLAGLTSHRSHRQCRYYNFIGHERRTIAYAKSPCTLRVGILFGN